MIDIRVLEDFVKPYYENKDIMHNLSHIERVLKYVNKLVIQGKYEVDIDILTYSAYFHGCIYCDEEKIVNWLKDKDISVNKINQIIKTAWESQKNSNPETLEGKVLHDAHMIEGGKNYLIVKSLITGSVRGQTLDETVKYIEDNILGKGTCYLSESIEIYKQQQEFAKEFIKDLKEGLD